MAGEVWSKAEEKEYIAAWNDRPKGENVLTFSKRMADNRSATAIRFKLANLVDTSKMEEEPPAVLFMDIETLPSLGYFWERPWEARIIKVKEQGCVATWAARWMGDKRMMSDCLTVKETKTKDDRRICKSLWYLFEQADIVIAQNGDKFDIPTMNSRWWLHNYGPTSSYKTIDTLKIARRTFRQMFNSLDELGKYLGVGEKLRTGGKDLWFDFMEYKPEARKHMVRYNEGDIGLLERVYDKMRPWMKNHPKMSFNPASELCPVCRDANVKFIGYYTATVKQYKEYRCGHCKNVFHDSKAS